MTGRIGTIMSDNNIDFDPHLSDHRNRARAQRVLLAMLDCREGEPGFEENREVFVHSLLKTIVAEIGGCYWCLTDLIADLPWIAVPQTPLQAATLSAQMAAELDWEAS